MTDILDIKIDKASMRRVDKMLAAFPRKKRSVFSRAANKSSSKMRVIGRRAVRQASGLPGRYVNPIVQKFSPRGEGIGIAYINEAAQVSVFKLAHTQSGGGVSFIGPDKKEHFIADAFSSAKMKGVFVRTGGGRYQFKKQYRKFGGDSLDKATTGIISGKMLSEGVATFNAEMVRLAQLELDRAAGRK